MRFIRLKVRTRIYLGFAALAALGLCIALFGLYQTSDVGTEVSKMDALSSNSVRVLTMGRQFEAIRRGGTRYLIDAQASFKTEHARKRQPGGQAFDRREQCNAVAGAQEGLRHCTSHVARIGCHV